MSEQAPQIDVEEAFKDPEIAVAQREFNEYLDSRPYRDETGVTHNPQNNQPIDAEEYFNKQRAAHESAHEKDPQISYDAMTMPALARKLAEAEHNNNRIEIAKISDVLLDKLADLQTKQASTRPKHDAKGKEEADDNVWNRIMGVRDKELARLKKDDEPAQPEDQPEGQAEDEPDTKVKIAEAAKADPALTDAVLRLDAARDKFAEIAATRGRKTFTSASGKHGKQALENARYEYEKRRAAVANMELASARAAGVNPDEMELLKASIGKSDAKRLAGQVRDERYWQYAYKHSKRKKDADKQADVHLEKMLSFIDSSFDRGDGATVLNSPRPANHIEAWTNHEVRQRRTRLARKAGSVAMAGAVRVGQATRNHFKR
jgi:hypothetical protein